MLLLTSLENAVGVRRHFWSSWCNNFVLRDMGIKTHPHTPYSPGHDPCAFQFFFPKLKEKLRIRSFEDIEIMKEAVIGVWTLLLCTPWGIYEMAGVLQKVHWSQTMLHSEGYYSFEINKCLFWKLQTFCKAPSRLETSIIASCVRYLPCYPASWLLPNWFFITLSMCVWSWLFWTSWK